MNSKNNKVKSSSTRKLVKFTILVILLLSICFGAFRIYNHYYNKIDSSASGPTSAQKKQTSEQDAENKKNFINSSADTASDSSQSADTPVKIEIDLSARQESNGTVTIIAKLPGVSAGNCALSITNGLKTINLTAEVIYQPEFSTCAGFTVPVSSLGSGDWAIVLKLSGSSDSSSTINLKVN